ncbi:hypothetical protein Sjap_002724 [Stephania japonica]|uniref:Kinesin motor domain-containing protein n=1 Tax=Stephania japonica TaxID=461633 RepID=A0AAP0PUT1_9MAGN
MNMESSRSHCAYIFTVQQESVRDTRLKTGKLILLDLAGSEKIEKTGAEGKILEEVKTINKSLSALGHSKAINIANRLGLPKIVIDDALVLYGTASSEINEVRQYSCLLSVWIAFDKSNLVLQRY